MKDDNPLYLIGELDRLGGTPASLFLSQIPSALASLRWSLSRFLLGAPWGSELALCAPDCPAAASGVSNCALAVRQPGPSVTICCEDHLCDMHLSSRQHFVRLVVPPEEQKVCLAFLFPISGPEFRWNSMARMILSINLPARLTSVSTSLALFLAAVLILLGSSDRLRSRETLCHARSSSSNSSRFSQQSLKVQLAAWRF
jgi:hypothetical protein